MEGATYGGCLVSHVFVQPLHLFAPGVNHGAPRTVLVLGGGEGATVREVLKWKTVERVVMVDIDGEVVEACKRYLPEMHQGAFDDPRTELVIGDALAYLDRADQTWDIIISDLSDPIEEGPSFRLFTKEYFAQCRRALKPDGYFVVQAGSLAPPEMGLHVRLVKPIRSRAAATAQSKPCVSRRRNASVTTLRHTVNWPTRSARADSCREPTDAPLPWGRHPSQSRMRQ